MARGGAPSNPAPGSARGTRRFGKDCGREGGRYTKVVWGQSFLFVRNQSSDPATQKVTRGGKYMTPALAEKIAFAMASPSTQAPHHILSQRELEVLRHIAAGKSLKEIAALLSLSVKSVGTYRARVLEKMTMSTNADLIRYVVEHNLRL